MDKEKAEKEIQKITRKIVEEFQPEKIILFGSWAWGTPGPDSDVDLLVIKQSEKSRPERQNELNAKFHPRNLPLDILVYTPSELEEKINKDRNLFLEDIINNGAVLYANDKIRG